MTSVDVWTIIVEALLVSAHIAGPLVLGIATIGIVVSLLQALTQIHEMTLSFVPKLLFIALMIYLTGPTMSDRFGALSRSLADRAAGDR